MDGASSSARAQANVEALRVARGLLESGAEPTDEELAALAAFSGWGPAANTFRTQATAADGRRLKTLAEERADAEALEILGDEGYALARESTLTAYYTPPEVAGAVLDALAAAGIGRGPEADRVLEPGCGSGTFMSMASGMGAVEFVGVECDPGAAMVARALNPGATVVCARLEDCAVARGSFDAAVGNVPFLPSDVRTLRDPDAGRVALHDYFLLETARSLRPGGIAALLTSSFTLDKGSASVREALGRMCEVVDAVRLPQETFSEHAATDPKAVDLIVLRRRAHDAGDGDESALAGSLADGSAFGPADAGMSEPVCRAFLPGGAGRVVGAIEEARPGDNGIPAPHVHVVHAGGVDAIASELAARLADTLGALGDVHASMGPRGAEAAVVPMPERAPVRNEYALGPAGDVFLGAGESYELVEPSAPGGTRLAGLVGLRDSVRALYALEASREATPRQVADAIASVRAAYDSFVGRFGRIGSAANRRAWDRTADRTWAVVDALELRAPDGTFERVADVLERRVLAAAAPDPESLDDPMEALAASMNRFGRPDPGYIAGLLGCGPDEAVAALGDTVVETPSGTVALADEWLSGDLGARLAEIDAALAAPRSRMLAARREWTASIGAGRVLSSAGSGWADALAAELTARGVWAPEVGSCGPSVAVHGGAAVSKAAASRLPDGEGGFYSEWSHGAADAASVAMRYLDDVEASGRPAEAGKPRPVWEWVCRNVRRFGEDGEDLAAMGRGTPRAQNWKDVCRTAVLARASQLAHDGLLSPDDLARYVGALMGARDPWDRGRPLAACLMAGPLAEVVSATGWERDRAPGEDAVRAVAAALADAPEMAEYALHSAALAGRGEDADGEGYGGFLARRERRLADALAPGDDGRVRALEGLRARVEAALPAALSPGEIGATLGSPWVPADVYLEFLAETFGYEGRAQDSAVLKVRVEHDALSGGWTVAGGGTWSSVPEDVRQRWGVVGDDGNSYNGFMVAQARMNGSEIRIMRETGATDDQGRPVREVDVEATARAQAASEALDAEFRAWVWADPARCERLGRIYNERHNRIALRRVDGSYLTFPGQAAGVELRPHQRDGVARVLQAREGTLLDHVVGAGKTFTGIAACHEAKRIGKCRKPLVVAQGATVSQWAAQWAQLYPADRVLAMGDADRGPAARERFWAAVRAGDWDAVIVPHSALDLLELSPEVQESYWRDKADRLLSLALSRKESGLGAKAEEKARQRAEAKVAEAQRLAGRSGEVECTHFDETGVDMLAVDEAQYYKNLGLEGSIDVPGIPSGGSGKCDKLMAKLDWMRSRGLGANIVFMTGTPVSNSMVELYNMQRYLSPGILASTGCEAFGDWASTFGRVVTTLEVDVTADRLRSVRRLAKFSNVPELMAAYRTVADVVRAEDVDLHVPQCKVVPLAVEPTDEQRALVAEISGRADAVRAGMVDPHRDNMLKITNDGRCLAISTKMLHRDDADYTSEDDGKLACVAGNVARIWREEAAALGAQLVFCDLGTPTGAFGWDVYSDLAERIEAAGVPAAQIASVYDCKTDAQRDALFARVRSGEVRVLMGSTAKLGTGVNVQDRLAAIHHVDCPWRPADIEQRRGRVQRQGNMYAQVSSYHYVTQGTFDSYLYQTVERKARFIAQMSVDPVKLEREIDDIDQQSLDYATIKELTVSDPAVLERTHLANEVGRLSLEGAAHAKRRTQAQQRLETALLPRLEALEHEARGIEAGHQAFAAAAGALGEAVASVCGRGPIADRREANRALIAARDSTPEGVATKVADYAGVEVWLTLARGSASVTDRMAGARLSVRCGGGGLVESHSPMPSGLSGSGSPLSQVDRLIRQGAAGVGEERLRELERARADVAAARAAASEPWDGAAALAEAKSRLAELDAQNGADAAAQADGPRPAERRSTPADDLARDLDDAARAAGMGAGACRRTM